MTSDLIKLQQICTKFRRCPSVRTALLVYHGNIQVFRKYLLRNFLIRQREGKDAVVILHVINT